MSFVYDNRLAVAVALAKQFAINIAEALAVHCSNVHVSQTSVRQTVYKLAVALYPTLIQKVGKCAFRYALYHNIECLAALSLAYSKAYWLANLAIQQLGLMSVFFTEQGPLFTTSLTFSPSPS